MWRLGFWALLSVLVAGVPLGIGRRALDEFAALAPTKRRGISATTIAEDAHVQLDFGRAEARLQAAKALVHETIGRTWDTVLAGDPLSDEASCRLGLASHEAMEAALHAVDVAYRFAGASATYSGQPLERCFRDVHTASQHIVFSGMLPQAYARYRTGQH